MNIGQVIRALRIERGLTQEELALEAGLATSNVSRIENGQRQPSLLLLQRLASALGTTTAVIHAASEPRRNLPNLDLYSLAPSALDAFPESPLSATTLSLLRHFQALSPENQALTLEHIKLLKRMQEEKSRPAPSQRGSTDDNA